MNNPFEPPQSPVSDPAPRAGSAVKAVLLGLAVDIGGTLLSSVVFGVVYAVLLGARGVPAEQMQDSFMEAMESGWGFALSSAVGCAFSVLGGYVCARIARRSDYRAGWALAGLSVGLGFLLGGASYNLLQHVLLAAVTVACVLIGVRSGMRATAAR